MARLSAKQRGDMRALEHQIRLPQTNPVSGAGYMDDDEQLVGSGAGDLQRLVGSGKKKKRGGAGANAKMNPKEMGEKMAHELNQLHGAGFFNDFADGFKKGFNAVMSPVAGVVKAVAPAFGPQGMAASGVLGALGYGNIHDLQMKGGSYEGQGILDVKAPYNMMKRLLGRGKKAKAEPEAEVEVNFQVEGGKKAKKPVKASDGRTARAVIVKRVMKEKGLSMIEASKYVKANGLY